jgi:hypothetical protein
VDFIVDPKQVIFTGKIVLYPTMIAKCWKKLTAFLVRDW